MKKKIFKIMIITLIIFLFPFKIYAKQNDILDKWVIDKETNNVYYYENGKKITGFKKIDGKTYFFGLTSGKMLTGWQSVDGEKFYLFPEIREGLQTIEGNKYYIKDNYIKHGFQTAEDGKTYFFGLTSGKMLTGWQSVDGEKFYLFPEIREGLQTIEGNKYYIKDNYIKHGFQTAEDGKTYFFGLTSGKMLTGWQSVDGEKFYLFPEIREGLQTIEGNKYYIKDNYIKHGFQTAEDGKTYFFGLTSGKMLTGWQSVDGKKFYLDDDGRTLSNGLHDLDNDGKFYYFIDNYVQTGLQKIDDDYYYFDLNNGKMIKAQFVKYNGNNYFFGRTTGKMQHGWMDWEGNTYYADLQTGALLSGVQLLENRNIPGQMNYYLFGASTNKLMTGWQSLKNNIYYADITTGVLVTEHQTISGRDYLFDENGILQGFREIDGKTYYYDPDSSEPVKGIQRIAGKYYKFNSITGAFENYVNQKVVIDVSFANNNIDWDKAWNTGEFDAVIMRLGFGSRSIDAQFYNNLAALKRLGIPYSVYLFSYAENYNEAVSEANFVINTMRKNGVYPSLDVYLDLEYWYNSSTGHTSNNISKESYEVIVKTFVSLLNQSGYKAGVYASKNYALERFNANTRPYVTWIAQYNSTCTYPGPYYGWQYTSDGWIDGIGRVDMSYFYY